MFFRWMLGAALALAPAIGHSQARPLPNSQGKDPFLQVDQIFSNLQDQGRFNGVVLVGEGDRIRFAKAYGVADYGTKRPLTLDSVFQLASISKAFTATAVGILADQGKLGLDDPLSKFIPDLPYQGITLRQMLSHTSGLPEYKPLFEAPWPATQVATNEDVIRVLAERKPPLRFSPGEKWKYSNTGYALLASVIERVSKTSYAAFLKQQVFEPLGMKDTQVLTSLSRDLPQNLALGFIRRSSLSPEAYGLATSAPGYEYATRLGGIVGDGGVHASAPDLLRWARALGTHRLLKPATMAQIQAPGRLRDGNPLKAEIGAPFPTTYAMGWFTRADGPKVYWHGGGWPGYVTYLQRDEDRDRTIVVLDNGYHHDAEHTFDGLAAVLDGKPYAQRDASIADTLGPLIVAKGAAAGIARYRELKATSTGTYRFAEFELNGLGYDLMEAGRLEDAIAIFALNVELFPQSADVYDGLGEAYLKHGDRELALANYEKSVKLDPMNENGLKVIQQLRSGKGIEASASFQTDANLDQLFSSLHEQGRFNGVVLVAEGDRVRFAKPYGFADFSTQRRLTLHSVFELASITKTFTATAVAILADRGKMGLDDPLTKHLPELSYIGITLRQMLTHTSGLPDYFDLFEAPGTSGKVVTNEDVIRVLAEKKPPALFAPGERWMYSDTGYVLLASVIERVSGTSYASFLKQHIFEPLGMKDTRVLTGLDKEGPHDQALGFIRASSSSEAYALPASVPKHEFMTRLGGVVGDIRVNATAGDLLRWARGQGTSRLVNPAMMAQILAPGKLRDGSTAKADGGAPFPHSYGLGWFIRMDGPKVLWHMGSWPGFVTYLERDQDQDRTIVVLDNCGHREAVWAGDAVGNYGRSRKVDPDWARKTLEKLGSLPQ